MSVRTSEGYGSSPQSGASRELLIPQRKGQLAQEISGLMDAAQQLEKRLVPVMRPMEAKMEKGDGSIKNPSPVPVPPMAADILRDAEQVQTVREMLTEILDRLEI